MMLMHSSDNILFELGSVCCSTVFIIRIPIGQWLMGLGDFPGGTEPV